MSQMPTQSTLQSLLTIATEATAAGAQVLSRRAQIAPTGIALSHADTGIETKSSASDLVTDFDKRAEDAVREVIAAYRPHDVISGEEYGTTEVSEPTGYRWSIDPLDGTTNFVRGVVYYGTSVGLQAPSGEWIIGVVEAPVLRRRWWAIRGQGAYTAHDDHPEQIRLRGPRGVAREGLLATGFGYDAERRQDQAQAVAAMLETFGNLRRLGAAALDMCMVADGTLDAYAEYGIQEHDWAAGALIAEEAGLQVYRPAFPDGNADPDWCVVGELGIELNRLSPPPRAF
ncbi:inositol monophosphatase family protein [Nesterenkonia alba]|uniref:inositol monophosphatase family protein n=1 Tax=Nesterenkonia alba TaxID=515814 RepID=UPI0004231A83|nr:inositol monophosphatase family protein [Nesterenkonia alba]